VSQFDEGQAFDRLINAPKAKIGVPCVDDAVSKIRKMKVARVVEWQTARLQIRKTAISGRQKIPLNTRKNDYQKII
jgi:hypothetical protein